jgi:hypothetical protein
MNIGVSRIVIVRILSLNEATKSCKSILKLTKPFECIVFFLIIFIVTCTTRTTLYRKGEMMFCCKDFVAYTTPRLLNVSHVNEDGDLARFPFQNPLNELLVVVEVVNINSIPFPAKLL